MRLAHFLLGQLVNDKLPASLVESVNSCVSNGDFAHRIVLLSCAELLAHFARGNRIVSHLIGQALLRVAQSARAYGSTTITVGGGAALTAPLNDGYTMLRVNYCTCMLMRMEHK